MTSIDNIRITVDGKPYRLVLDEPTVTPEMAVAPKPYKMETPERPAKLEQMMAKSEPSYPTLDDLLNACRDCIARHKGDKSMYIKTKDLIAMRTPTGDGVAKDVPAGQRQALIDDINAL